MGAPLGIYGYLLGHILTESCQDGSHLSAGSGSLGLQGAVGHAVDEAVLNGPGRTGRMPLVAAGGAASGSRNSGNSVDAVALSHSVAGGNIVAGIDGESAAGDGDAVLSIRSKIIHRNFAVKSTCLRNRWAFSFTGQKFRSHGYIYGISVSDSTISRITDKILPIRPTV